MNSLTNSTDKVGQALATLRDALNETADKRPAHEQVIEQCIEATNIKLVEDPAELLDFLAGRVKFWCDKAETAINSVDFRQCRSEAQLNLFFYQMARSASSKPTNPE